MGRGAARRFVVFPKPPGSHAHYYLQGPRALVPCSLFPAVGSTPLVTVERHKAAEKQLTCTSDGWFPQPHVQWKDTEGRIVPSDPAVLHQGQNGLFDVESHLLVTNSSVMNVACSVSNLPLGEEKTVAVSLSESKMNFSWKMLPVLGLLLVVTIGLIWMNSCKKGNLWT
ncbi:butyrophilin-like protein 2 [Cavia porcellus]|uniref:butyrophilin-like protein 2 n=1 Tax=Cavia porcellus TaxID=10141 RepID=UPI002FE3D4F4